MAALLGELTDVYFAFQNVQQVHQSYTDLPLELMNGLTEYIVVL